MGSDAALTTTVEIFGTRYPVRGDRDGARLHELAAVVDRRMQDIAEQMGSAEPVKIAILAALNFADELSQVVKQQDGERLEVREKAAELSGEIERALSR
jgi:cell division protein ZapA